jgi:hypothetical protein
MEESTSPIMQSRPASITRSLRKADLYLGFFVAAGLIVVGRSLWFWRSDHPWLYFCFLVIAVLSSGLKVSLWDIKGTIEVAYIFVLLSLIQFSMSETILLSLSSCLVQCLWRPNEPAPWAETNS